LGGWSNLATTLAFAFRNLPKFDSAERQNT
jgi:hypothetical protein